MNGMRTTLAPALTLTLTLLMAVLIKALEQKFANEPNNQTAIVGERVVLPCRIINKAGQIQWTKDDFGLGNDRNLTGFDRYHMIGSDEEGDYSLEIFPVTLEDDASFQCQVSPNKTVPGIRSRFAKLTVLVPPEPPRIVQGDFLVTTEDREIQIECTSRKGKPPADITWLVGDVPVPKEQTNYSTVPFGDGKRETAKSILKLIPKMEHHNTTISCQAQNQADTLYKSAFIKLEVKFAPKVSVTIESSTVSEHDVVRVRCSAKANPSDVIYKWYINDEFVPGDHTTELVIHNVTRRHHDAMVKCEVHNSVGKSEESETLRVTYGPRFRNRPRNAQAEEGGSVTLSCDVDGNPTPEIVWLHEKSHKVVSTSPNLTLTLSEETSGTYTCRASVPGFQSISAEAVVYPKGPPHIKRKNIQFGVQGDNVRLECAAHSIPKPERVIWTYRGREVDTNDPEYSILEDPITNGIKSTLVIRDSQERHFGSYNCSVINPYGTDIMEISLRRKKSLPLLIILVGVIGCVIIIVAITMIIILCQRRSKKHDDVDIGEKQSKQSDRSSNDSDLKVEIRTASSLSNVHEHDSEQGWEEGSESTNKMPVNGGDTVFRYSADYTEPAFPPKADGQNNNGYVPYVDYSRDYNPPPIENNRASLYGAVDPRYSAAYGNPYLRTSVTSLPPPHSTATFPTRNGAVPQVARLPSSPTSQYIVPTSQAQVKRGTLATHV